MINKIVEKIESTRKMIKFRRNQLEQAANYIRKESKINRDALTKKFSIHIETLKKYFDDYRKRHSEMLNEALVFQADRTEEVLSEIGESLETLDSDS